MLLLPDGLLARASFLDTADCGTAYCCQAWQPGSVPPPQPGAGSWGGSNEAATARGIRHLPREGLRPGQDTGHGCGQLETGTAAARLGQRLMAPGDNEMGSWAPGRVRGALGGSWQGPEGRFGFLVPAPAPRRSSAGHSTCRPWARGRARLPAPCRNLPRVPSPSHKPET